MKKCTKCGKSKPMTEFHKRKDTADSRRSACKACTAISRRNYYAKNSGVELMSNRARREANLESARAAERARYAANPGRSIAASRAWQMANRERHLAVKRVWQAGHQELRRIAEHNRRARKRSNGGKLSHDITKKLLLIQRGKCACCGVDLGGDYHIDHIMPIALGGTNTDDNVQLLRAECNLSKGAKHPVEFMQQKGCLL